MYKFLVNECVMPEMYIGIESDMWTPEAEAAEVVKAALLLHMLFKFGRPLDYHRNTAGFGSLYRVSARLNGGQLAAKLDVNDINPILDLFHTLKRTNDSLRDKKIQEIH